MWNSQTDRDVCQLSMRDGDGPRFRSVTDRAPCICAYLRVASCLHVCVTAASNTITILHVLLIAITTTSIIDNITTSNKILVDSAVSALPHQVAISPS